MHKYSYKQQICGIARFNSNVNNVFACQEQNFIITANKTVSEEMERFDT